MAVNSTYTTQPYTGYTPAEDPNNPNLPAAPWASGPGQSGTYPGVALPLPDGKYLNYQNPASMSPWALNPSANQYLQNNGQLMSQVQGSMLNPAQYGQMQALGQTNLTTSLGNQYARMGLAGSSAEMGGISQAINQNQMNWLNRQQGDMAKYASTMGGLNQAGFGDTLGIQSQFGDYESTINDYMMGLYGMKSQEQQASDHNWAQVASAGVGAIGVGAAVFSGGAVSPSKNPGGANGGGGGDGSTGTSLPGSIDEKGYGYTNTSGGPENAAGPGSALNYRYNYGDQGTQYL